MQEQVARWVNTCEQEWLSMCVEAKYVHATFPKVFEQGHHKVVATTVKYGNNEEQTTAFWNWHSSNTTAKTPSKFPI